MIRGGETEDGNTHGHLSQKTATRKILSRKKEEQQKSAGRKGNFKPDRHNIKRI